MVLLRSLPRLLRRCVLGQRPRFPGVYAIEGEEVKVNPLGAENGKFRVVRGGSWLYSSWFCRVAYRDYYVDVCAECNLGFRVCMSLKVRK